MTKISSNSQLSKIFDWEENGFVIIIWKIRFEFWDNTVIMYQAKLKYIFYMGVKNTSLGSFIISFSAICKCFCAKELAIVAPIFDTTVVYSSIFLAKCKKQWISGIYLILWTLFLDLEFQDKFNCSNNQKLIPSFCIGPLFLIELMSLDFVLKMMGWPSCWSHFRQGC